MSSSEEEEVEEILRDCPLWAGMKMLGFVDFQCSNVETILRFNLDNMYFRYSSFKRNLSRCFDETSFKSILYRCARETLRDRAIESNAFIMETKMNCSPSLALCLRVLPEVADALVDEWAEVRDRSDPATLFDDWCTFLHAFFLKKVMSSCSQVWRPTTYPGSRKRIVMHHAMRITGKHLRGSKGVDLDFSRRTLVDHFDGPAYFTCAFKDSPAYYMMSNFSKAMHYAILFFGDDGAVVTHEFAQEDLAEDMYVSKLNVADYMRRASEVPAKKLWQPFLGTSNANTDLHIFSYDEELISYAPPSAVHGLPIKKITLAPNHPLTPSQSIWDDVTWNEEDSCGIPIVAWGENKEEEDLMLMFAGSRSTLSQESPTVCGLASAAQSSSSESEEE
jgi:hypothetical protein